MSGTVVVVGGTTFDLFASGLPGLPRIDDVGDEFTARSLVHLPSAPTPSVGGNAGNAAFVAARLAGRTVRLVTALGKDLFGNWLREQFGEVGVELTVLPPVETSVNVVATDVAGQRLSLFRPVHIDTESVLRIASSVRLGRGDVVLLAGYPHPAPTAIAAWARAGQEGGATVAIDVGPGVAGLTVEVLSHALPHIDLVLANELELRVLSPDVEPSGAALGIAAKYGAAVVVKAGRRGVTYVTAGEQVHVPAFPTRGTGPTVGAGDAFNAGFLCRLQDGIAPVDAVRFGAAVAAAVVERGLGVLGAPNCHQTELFVRSHDIRPHLSEDAANSKE